ncbi:Hypothetical predicted protein [Mytilus galloprovincialis]|uniref:Uncharacterized protein n=1 Tax=Mytilus galloprovincialis TaxID=29158 RepID=A0A8B6BFA3_MYTGA|nr:Hypothetical predicted protein [Mytilus galloprovincialis]
MIKKDPNYPGYFYCFEQEVTREFIFQHYKAKGIERILTTCSLSCIVSYFRPLPDKADEPFVNIDSSIYQKVAIQIIRIIRKNLKTSVSDAISSVKTLCMSPLLQDENFLMELMIACDKLLRYRYSVFAQTETFNFGYDKIDSLEAFHFPSLLLYQSCRQLSMMYGENVKVVKTIFQKVSDSREANKDHVEISQTINKLVRFSMEELCKENNDVNAALEMLWKFIIDNGIDCQYNDFLKNALRNQCPQTVIWLRENVIEPNCLQMEKCFIDICLIPDVDKADWFLEHVRENRTEQNPFNLYGAFKEALHRNSESLMKVIWKWEERILEDYRHLYPDIDIENSKKKIANMVMDISLNEQNIRSHSEIFSWANDIFKPHSKYFEENMISDIKGHEREHVTSKITFT